MSTPLNAKGGKGGLFGAGGKASGQTYDYGAAVIIAICQGPILSINNIWDTQGTLPTNDTEETYTIPSGGGSYTATQQNTYQSDLGVTGSYPYSVAANDYGSPTAGTPVIVTGTQQTPFIRGSVSHGHYTESGGTYTFSGADAGVEVTISYAYGPPNTIGSDPIQSLNLTLFNGALGQAPWGWLVTNHPDQALGYTGVAYVATPRLDLGESGALPNLTFEVIGFLYSYGLPSVDVDPALILQDLLPNPIYGCGLSTSDLGSFTQYNAYCTANGVFFSPVLDQSRTAAEYIDEWLKASNAEMLRVGFQLSVLPYGDTTAIGNGKTFTPQTQPVYDLDDDDFIREENEDPVIVKRPSIQDAYNAVRIEYVDRGNNYNPGVVTAEDLNAEQLYTFRPESPRQYHFICEQTIAATVSQTLLARMVFIRNTYSFKLPGSYILLNPMDLVTITDPCLPSYPNSTPVRITSINENKQHELEIEAEEFPWGCSGPTEYPKQSAASSIVQANSDPGMTNPPILFEAVARLRAGNPQQELWMALSGNSITVNFLAGGGSGATGHALIANGSIVQIVVDEPGSGYTTGEIYEYAIANGGIGYAAGDTGTVNGGSIPATYQVLTVDSTGAVLTFSLTDNGYGYAVAGGVIMLRGGARPGSGSGFTLNITTVAATVSFGGTLGSGAVASAPISGGEITSDPAGGPPLISNGGIDYESAWGGCHVWMSTDGEEYTPVATQQGAATIGVTTSSWPAATDPDTTNNLSVDLTESNGTLPNFTSTQENNFASLFYVEGGYGPILYELGAYSVATMTGPNQYTLDAVATPPVPNVVVVQSTSGSDIWQQTPVADTANVKLISSDVGATADVYLLTVNPDLIVLLAPSAGGNFTVAHGLGTTPQVVMVQMTSGGAIPTQASPADASNLYLTASDSGITGMAFLWATAPALAGTYAKVSLSATSPGNFTVAHGMGVTPSIIIIVMSSLGKIWLQSPTEADGTDLFLTSSGSSLTGVAYLWA